MTKGFTKGKGKGKKFIPTSNKKTGLKKSDVGKKSEIKIKTYTPIQDRKKQTLGSFGGNSIVKEDDGKIFEEKNGKRVDEIRSKFTLDDYESNEERNAHLENALELAKKYGTKQEVDNMISAIHTRDSTGHIFNFEYDEEQKIHQKYYKQFKADTKDERSKFSLGGSDKDKAKKRKEEDMKDNEKRDKELAHELADQDNQNLKSLEKSEKFLTKRIEDLQKNPAKFGTNAEAHLGLINEARDNLKKTQSDIAKIKGGRSKKSMSLTTCPDCGQETFNPVSKSCMVNSCNPKPKGSSRKQPQFPLD